MKEVLKKLEGFNKKWVKRSIAFVLCLTVTFAAMPTMASNIASNNESETDYGISLPILDDEDYENIQQSQVENSGDEEGDTPESSEVTESESTFESGEVTESESTLESSEVIDSSETESAI